MKTLNNFSGGPMFRHIIFSLIMIAMVSCKERSGDAKGSEAFAEAPGNGYSMSCEAGDFPNGQQFYMKENGTNMDFTMSGLIRDNFVPMDFLHPFFQDPRNQVRETGKIEFSMPKNQCKFSEEDPALFFCSSGVDFTISLDGIKFDNETVHVSGSKVSEQTYKGIQDYMKIHFFFNISRNGNTAVRYWPQFEAHFAVDSPNSIKNLEGLSGSRKCVVAK
jgi:hypothetical protein